jgi:glutamine synthetase
MLEPKGIGNGTHIHFSLCDASGAPATHDAAGPHGLSAVAEKFAAGVLHNMPALAAVTAPSVASYFRLTPDRWAPTRADLGAGDRGASLRICPTFAPRDAADTAAQFNLEYRVCDAAASPYMALGALVHAGVDGIRRGLALPVGAPPLPRSLGAALDALHATPAAKDWFGAGFLDAYLMFKKSEIAALSGLDDDAICARYAEVY